MNARNSMGVSFVPDFLSAMLTGMPMSSKMRNSRGQVIGLITSGAYQNIVTRPNDARWLSDTKSTRLTGFAVVTHDMVTFPYLAWMRIFHIKGATHSEPRRGRLSLDK